MKKNRQNRNQKRSISSNEKNIKKMEIKEKEKDDNINSKKGFHHRKRTSSYFLGSYLPDLNFIENNFQMTNENENINDKEEENNIINNGLIYNLANIDNLNELSLSFPSYEENNNNSGAIKNENNEKTKNINVNNNNILDIAKKSENSSKSFITFKNSLKYLKDIDERATPSYQLALQADKKGGKNNYLASSNIIEEEKSSMIESKSEFSNKKDLFKLEKEKTEKEKIQNEHADYFTDLNINNNWKFHNGKLENKNEMALALNEIIIKNNKKEEERKNYLSKNKKVLLNTFFTMSNILKTKEIKCNKEKYINSENNKNDMNKNNIESFSILKNKINSNGEYFIKKKFFKKSSNYYNQNYTFSEREIRLNNTTNNSNKENYIETDFRKNMNKIPHLYNMRKNQKIVNDSPSDLLINIPYKSLKTSNSNNLSSRNNSQISKKLNKLLDKKDSRSNIHSIKRRENLNNALLFIREKKSNKLNDLEKKKYYNSNTYNISGNKKLTNITYTNSLTNSNMNTNNSNTQSHSKSKEKPQHLLRNANSSSFVNKIEQIPQVSEIYTNIESNKEQTIMCLKYKLMFNKLYEKIDVLEKVNITSISSKNFYVILCDNKLNLNHFIFNSLFKYYKDKKKFIKIYGDEKNPNYILLKDIIEKKKFQIYEDNNSIVNSSVNTFTLTNHFKFTNNAMIFVKNG